jgi:hypothetical protein
VGTRTGLFDGSANIQFLSVRPIRYAPSSVEVQLNWNKWVRQTHRWVSVAFTVGVIVNLVAVVLKKYTAGVGLMAGLPLALLLLTGLYLFALPYGTRWRGVRVTD